jgi:hypothetical protein
MTVALVLVPGVVGVPAQAADSSPARLVAVQPGKSTNPSVGSRVVTGTKSTGRYMPETFIYKLKVPTLRGVKAKVKKAFDKKIDSLISEELTYYGQGALTQDQFATTKKNNGGDSMSPEEWISLCHENFWDLSGKFASAMYKDRYASVVVTFSGQNAPCIGLGGLWSGYRTDRSVTIDTQTAAFKSVTDFTSNSSGKVTTAVNTWYANQSHEFMPKRPKLGAKLSACDRPGNVNTDSPTQKPCYAQASEKGLPLAWMVRDSGLRLTFWAGDGPRHATLKWASIPQRL